VDAGWRTLDWVVTSGGRIVDKRTDSVAKSLFDVIDVIARAIARDLGVQLGLADYVRIDEALGTNGADRRHPLSLEPYLGLGQRIADEAVTAMKRVVQDGTDIDAIVLAGGGAFFFGDAIGRAYPKHTVITLPEAFFANCRGFQLAALYQFDRERRRVPTARAGVA
jgi:plasmid segregation protein ParM